MYKIVNLKYLAILAVLLVVISSSATYLVLYPQLNDTSKYDNIVKLMEEHYLYDFDEADLQDGAYAGIVASLGDDYSYYMNAQGAQEFKADNAGQTLLLGITFAIHPDTGDVTVIYVQSQSAAAQSGIKAGDIIKSINGTDVKGLTNAQIANLTQKNEDATCNLTLDREGQAVEISTKLCQFVEDSVIYRNLGSVGYIEITDFTSATSSQFKTAVEDLKSQNVTAVVFDVRNNLGGLTDALGSVLNEILPKGDAVRAKSKDGSISVLTHTTGNDWDVPMAVLTNEYTASSAEIFALAIRDFDKGALVGTKTFGKGVMQTTFSFNDGTAVKLTTAELVDKNGETYNKIGITPDIEAEQSEYAVKYSAFITDEQDTQLQSALEYLKTKN